MRPQWSTCSCQGWRPWLRPVWSPPQLRDWGSFLHRLKEQLPHLDARNLYLQASGHVTAAMWPWDAINVLSCLG